MSERLQPLSIEELRPFPLEKSLQSLPQKFQDEFASSYELVKGYTRNLEAYRALEEQARQAIKDTITTINSISAVLEEYERNSDTIARQVGKLDALYKEFLTLETLQYQLLSTNYDQSFLKIKYAKLVAESDTQSGEILDDYRNSGGDMSSFLLRFKDSRKAYHGRREKLNRWEENRVSGFI
ncbi:hypothetical protein OXX69_007459 [Metschnikowia pulcherrima]